jgi:hypothetical protein
VEIDPASYREFDGMLLPTKSTVSWKLTSGDFEWLRLEIVHAAVDSDLLP